MGTQTLVNKNSGDTILAGFWNDIHGALEGDLLGRDSSGSPTSGQNLGSAAVPWGTIRAGSIVLGGSAIDTSQITSPVNRVVSGKKRSSSNQPAFITPNGAAASFILSGATTNLVVDINGSAVTVNTDITKGSLTTAPSSSNTATVNDSTASSQEATRTWGELESPKKITMTSAGSNITNLVGKFATFKLGSEYFMAYVESSTVLSKCLRGFFYDSSLNPINRAKFSNSATITLMKTGWVFITNDATTVDVTYNVPTWSVSSPTSPATGDYWYDLANRLWKRYDGASFQIINRTFIGIVVLDSTNCVAARCVDFYANYSSFNALYSEWSSNSVVQARKLGAAVSVAGNMIKWPYTIPTWNTSTMLAASADMYNGTLQVSTAYYLYVKDTGDTVISDISPYYRWEMLGLYHPHNPWRCIGTVSTDGSSNLLASSLQNFSAINSVEDVAFAVYLATTVTPAQNAAIIFDTVDYDPLGTYSTTTGKFTAPVEGTYHFNVTITTAATGSHDIGIYKNATHYADIGVFTASASTPGSSTASAGITLRLAAGDTVNIADDNASPSISGSGPPRSSLFSGYRVGRT